MPVKLGKKKYEKLSDASAAIRKKKGISKDRASAYVASVESKQGIEPRTGKKTKTTSRPRNSSHQQKLGRRGLQGNPITCRNAYYL